jgi:hypothetical protein
MTALFGLVLAAMAAPPTPYATIYNWDLYGTIDRNCSMKAQTPNGTHVIISRAAKLPGVTRIMFRQRSWASIVPGKSYPAKLQYGGQLMATPAIGYQGNEGIWLLFAVETNRFKRIISKSPIIGLTYNERLLTPLHFAATEDQVFAELDRCAGEPDDPFN